jgi:tol-pal system protein YbgF
LKNLEKPKVGKLYSRARDLFKAGQFKVAAQAFAEITTLFPRHRLAGNAVYWQGVCRYELGDYPGAIEILQTLATNFPTSPKVADSILMIGQSYLAMGDKLSARVFFNQVVERYPQSEAARKATSLVASGR